MERHILFGSVALALVLGAGAAPAQTPSDRNPAQSLQPPQHDSGAAQNNHQPQPGTGQAQTQPNVRPPQQGGAQQPGVADSAGAGATGQQNGPQGQRGVISLNEQQNTRVTQAIRQAKVKPLTNVTFSVAVGAEVPASVLLHVLPPALVDVVPEYRGYSFVVVEQEAIIVDPGTHAIVAVVPFEETVGATATPSPAPAPAVAAAVAPVAPAPVPARKSVRLSRDQREILRRQASRHRKVERRATIEERHVTTGAGLREPRVGDRVPDSVPLESFSDEVYREVPAVRGYRYYGTGRRLMLVDPADRGVIEDIE